MYKHVLGIHGDPIESKRKILQARRTGVRFEGDAYSYDRAFAYYPTTEDREWIRKSIKLSDRKQISACSIQPLVEEAFRLNQPD